MSKMTFEDLDAWQQARKLVNEVYTLTRAEPLSRDYGLKDQIQRASVSVMTNIAEGFERSTIPDKVHFYNMARASNGEVRSLSYVVQDNFPNQEESALGIRKTTDTTGRLLSGLLASTRKRLAMTSLSLLLVVVLVGSIFLHFF